MSESLHRSTSEFAKGEFPPHGHVDMWLEGSILRYDALGPFNRELVSAIATAQHKLMLTAKAQGKFAEVVTIRTSALVTPDGLEELTRLLQDVNRQHLAPVVVAYVMGPEVEGATLMGPVFTQRYEAQGRTFKVFDDVAQAYAWAVAALDQQP